MGGHAGTGLGNEVRSAGKDKDRRDKGRRAQDLDQVGLADNGEGNGAELIEEGHFW